MPKTRRRNSKRHHSVVLKLRCFTFFLLQFTVFVLCANVPPEFPEASKPESKENGKGKTSEKPKSKEGKDTKDTKASDKAKKSKDEVSRDQSRETKTKNAKSYKEKAKD